jgi:hypothetical protein
MHLVGRTLGLLLRGVIFPAMPKRPGFRYWRDPLCVVAVLLYVANSVWWKPMTADPSSFVHCYLGDLLCLPVCVPVTLWLQRRVGLRRDDCRPTPGELLLHWLLWSACFEWIGPQMPLLAPGAVSDPWDAVAYGVGGLLAALIWRSQPSERLLCPGPTAAAMVGRVGIAMIVALLVLSAYRFGIVFR